MARHLAKAYNIYERPRDIITEAVFGGTRHDTFWALHDVSFEIRDGDRVGFIGPNGAGKSTLLKVITGNLQPTKGELAVNGRVSALLSLTSFLDLEATGAENIRFNLTLAGVPTREIPGLTEEIIDFTELGAFIKAPVRTYSSGMSARLSFAISTAITPDILVVDEVLGAGDAYFAAKATMRMIELCNQGRALLFVSHSLSAVQLLCNRAIWMDSGVIREDGDVDEVIRRYEADFRRQEDESVRADNRVRRRQRVDTVFPEEMGRSDVARVRLVGPTGRVADTHYVRRIALSVEGEEHDVPLGHASLDDDSTAGVLDLVRSEWGRPHERRGSLTRALGPSSRALRGGHVLLRRPGFDAGAEAIVLSIESTSIGGGEPLKIQLADAESGRWLDLEFVERVGMGAGWERAVFRGAVAPVDSDRHDAMLKAIFNESRPEVEVLDARMIVGGEKVVRVRERVPFQFQVDIRANSSVELADVALKIVRSDGYYVFWQSSGLVGANLDRVVGEHRLIFEFDPNILGAGDYDLTVEVQNGFDVEHNFPYSRVYDRKVGILRFTVDREWSLVMFGQVNYRFPVRVEALAPSKTRGTPS
jgi:lipopolysaccharide transport system ATP-binding protein